jgi:hypothetical protein
MRLALALLLLPLTAAGGAVPPLEGPATPRAVHSATVLASGEVLIAGGCTVDGCETDARGATTELFDPATRRFRPGPPLTAARVGHAAVRLRDGSVLVMGGWRNRLPTASVERLRPGARRFVQGEALRSPRGGFTVTVLRDGRVLIAGGEDGSRVLRSAELFDPRTGRFRATGAMRTPRAAHAAALLPDGRVLVTGGSDRRRVHRSAEVYDPRTGRFRPASPMAVPRHKHAAVMVGGGVLIAGGSDARDFAGRYASAELYLAATGRFVPVASMRSGRFKHPDAVVALPSGRALVAGGAEEAEVYEPATRSFRQVAGTGRVLSFATATRLRDGSVLVVGGYDDRIALAPEAWLLAA